MIFSYRLAGIPCQIEVLNYYHLPAKTYGLPEDCYPEEFDFEFRVLDRKGYGAAWLERKLNSDIEADILSTYLNIRESYYDDY